MIGVLPIESHENFIAGNDMIHMVSVESYTQGIKVDEQRLKIMEGAKRIVAVVSSFKIDRFIWISGFE
jgi:hypothetical protein